MSRKFYRGRKQVTLDDLKKGDKISIIDDGKVVYRCTVVDPKIEIIKGNRGITVELEK